MFRDTIPFKLSFLEKQLFGKTKMEFLNLLNHLLFHALLQSSLVDTRTLWCFFLVQPLSGPLCMAVIPVQHTNPSFSVHCMAPTPSTWLYWRSLGFCVRMLHVGNWLQCSVLTIPSLLRVRGVGLWCRWQSHSAENVYVTFVRWILFQLVINWWAELGCWKQDCKRFKNS